MSRGQQELRDDDPLCEWDGPLLPLEDVDYEHIIDHGTDKGYQQHRRYKLLPVCEPCQMAHRDSRRAERDRERARRK